jgi:mevalonate kinase
MATSFHAHGKLLLTAEYFVLDGALALAVPVRRGQSLTISGIRTDQPFPVLRWESLDLFGKTWFHATFRSKDFELLSSSDRSMATRLQHLLTTASMLNPAFSPAMTGYRDTLASTRLDFPREWGLGTSSTLISLLARWSRTNPFSLSYHTFGGSGYDVACATADTPILYRLQDGSPQVEKSSFAPPFADQLSFVYLGQKQDSRDGILRYRARVSDHPDKLRRIARISELTAAVAAADSFDTFAQLLREHETIVSETIGLPTLQDRLFPDFDGVLKSLGAWGGDFALAASRRPAVATKDFFNEKGFPVFFLYQDLVHG